MFLRRLLFLPCVFIVLILFQMSSVSVYAEKISDNLKLAESFRKNTEDLLERNAKRCDLYGIDDRCFSKQKDGFIRMISFSDKKKTNQPETVHEKFLSEKLKISFSNHQGDTTPSDSVYDISDGMFHYLSFVRSTSEHCNRCHLDIDENANTDKFKAYGIVSIKFPVIN